MAKMNEYKKVTIFLIGVVALKVAFTFFADSYGDLSLRDLFSSVLNTQNIVSLTNESRKAAGLSDLKIDYKLRIAAQRKAEDMLKNQYFAHEGPTGKLAWDFMDESGYTYIYGGENLAMNFKTAEEVSEGWLASVTHKANIMNDTYTQIGVGVASGKFLGADTTVVVQMFGKPLRASAQKSLVAAKATPKALPPKKSKAIAKQVPVQNGGAKNVAVKNPVKLKEYISKLVQNNVADWLPAAKTSQVYAVSEGGVPTKKLLDLFFVYIVVSGVGIFAWRFVTK